LLSLHLDMRTQRWKRSIQEHRDTNKPEFFFFVALSNLIFSLSFFRTITVLFHRYFETQCLFSQLTKYNVYSYCTSSEMIPTLVHAVAVPFCPSSKILPDPNNRRTPMYMVFDSPVWYYKFAIKAYPLRT